MSLKAILESQVICVDVETTGLDWWKGDRVFGISVSAPAYSMSSLIENPKDAPVMSQYVDVRKRPDIYRRIAKGLARAPLVVNHNIKFDAHMMLNDKHMLPLDHCECTMIRAALIDEHRLTYDLDSVAKDCVGVRKQGDIYERLAEIFGGRPTRNVQMPNLQKAPIELVESYANQDTVAALRLWAWQEKEIRDRDLGRVWDLERRLFPIVFEMERQGIPVNISEAERVMDSMAVRITGLQRDLNHMAGFEVNPNPSKSLHRLFDPRKEDDGNWYAKDGTPLETTPAGKPSIGADALMSMKMPEADLVLRLRKMIKTRDTFVGGHILGHQVSGRVHPNINQTKGDDTGGTGTGRLSYTNPAMQQIPSRDKEVARIVRPIFIPEKGHGWTYGDLDQHELRIFHHYVNSPKIIKAYRANPDLDGHQAVADLTKLPRNAPRSGGANAKQINLAMVFNMGAGELADRMGLPFTVEQFTDRKGEVHVYKKAGPEAMAIFETYYRMVPGVREMATRASSIAKARGYVKTIFGRHLRFPGGSFTHKASGLIYQGSSADLNKDNIIRLHEFLASECPDARILLNIHDENSVSIPNDVDYVPICRGMRDVIQDRPEIRVPLRIDFSVPSANWWEATQAESVK